MHDPYQGRSHPRIAWAILTVPLLFGLAACKPADQGAAGTRTPAVGTSTDGQPAPSAGASQAASAASTRAPVIETRSEETVFVTPSKNITCAMWPEGVRCQPVEKSWTPPPRPANCPKDMDYGDGIVLSPSGVSFVCAGDTVVGADNEVLAYGHGIRLGQFVCISQESEVRCQSDAGRGFTMSRSAYTVF